ncbi:MAG: hypothetical protein RL304_771, partial [Verrucomicrobiota bacterium]
MDGAGTPGLHKDPRKGVLFFFRAARP